MNYIMSIFDRALSSMTGRTCENVVGAEARHILQTIGKAQNRVKPSGYVVTSSYECLFILISYEANISNKTVV